MSQPMTGKLVQASHPPFSCPGVGRLLNCLPELAGKTEAPGLAPSSGRALIVENDQVSLRGFVSLHDVPGEEQALVQGCKAVVAG